MPCRSRDLENSRRNDKEVARLFRGWMVLGASTIVSITTILCYGLIQSESIFSLLGSAASSGAATTDDTFDGGDDYMYNNDADEEGRDDGDDGGENNRNDDHQQRFLSEDDNHENEEHQGEDAGAEEAVEDDEAGYDDIDATTQSSSNFSLGISMPKYSMDGTEIFFLALMLVVALVLLPYGRRVLKDRKALNSRFGIGLFSSALIMYANLSFLFSLLLSYSGEVSALCTYGYAAWIARQMPSPRTLIYFVALLLCWLSLTIILFSQNYIHVLLACPTAIGR